MQQPPPNFSLHGAVDLGARQAAQRRQQGPASPGAQPGARAGGAQSGGPAAVVIDVTDETFTTEVVARSAAVPVIMDLWADWCGPCKQLSPVLEKLAAEADGAWILAKVDIDANPQLSAALQVQSIPMVVAVLGGQLVDGFMGAIPEQQVREWIGQILQAAARLGLAGPPSGQPAPEVSSGQAAAGGRPARREKAGRRDREGQRREGRSGRSGQRAPAGQRDAADLGASRPAGPPPGRPPGPVPGAGGPGEPGADPELAEAQQAMERGDLDAAGGAFEKLLAASPGHPVAVMGLAQIGLIRRVNSYDRAAVSQAAQQWSQDADTQAKMADIDVATGRVDAGFSRLLDTVRATSGEERNKARLHLIALFEVFPPRDPRVAKARATLSSLLF